MFLIKKIIVSILFLRYGPAWYIRRGDCELTKAILGERAVDYIMTKTSIKQHENDFLSVYQMIESAKSKAFQKVNSILISLYWSIGCYVSERVESHNWGRGIVEELSRYILSQDRAINGFSARNIWRMKQFYETYQPFQKLSALLTEISWTNHLHIISKTKTIEEKEFYLTLASKGRYPERSFARVIDSGTFERTMLANRRLSTALTEFPIDTKNAFKNSYVFEFLGLSDNHKEADLRKSLVRHLRKFILELGPDFTMMGEEYPIQVGMKDFRIDLLMHHRGLNCLVAIELKITEFQPEYLGKVQFYLEALDRDIKKPHENPSIGILICKTKDDEIVEYAMSRHASPTAIAEYETKLIDKLVLQKELREFSETLEELDMRKKP